MIQRIQSLYLLLVTGLLIAALFFPVGYLSGEGMVDFVFKPLGADINGEFRSTWGLFGLLLLSALIAFCTIFLFRNRMLQIRFTIFNSILLIGYYIVLVAFAFALTDPVITTFSIAWSTCLPLVALILNYLAIRAIGRDEVLVKAADRLR